MKFSSLCEVIAATHLSVYVRGPFEQRGGLMLVAPPGHLKTTAAEILSEFSKTLIISDLTVKSLTAMRETFIGSHVNTLIFSDYEKIHKRHSSVSSNIEGILMALVAEGFRQPAYSDQRIQSIPAYATIVGCMTHTFFDKMKGGWLDNGFYRRFMWARYKLSDPELLDDAIGEWRKAELDGDFSARVPLNRTIPYTLTAKEVSAIAYAIRGMEDDKKLAFILGQKVLCVLKWKFERKDEKLPLAIWSDFAEALSSKGATLVITGKQK